MGYYLFVKDETIEYKGQLPNDDINYECMSVSKEVYDNYEDYIYSNGEIVINPELDKIRLDNAKANKIELNDALRDEALSRGVEYQDVLFDSDTDQKTNLIGTILSMSDTDTITWFGMDNTALLCTKADLYAISNLIKELHSFCWGMNAHVKELVANAETVEDVEAIEISYNEN